MKLQQLLQRRFGAKLQTKGFLAHGLALAGLAMFSTSADAASLVIDDFTQIQGGATTGNQFIFTGAGTVTDLDTGLNSANTIGGQREIFATWLGGATTPIATSAIVNTDLQRFSVSNGDGTLGEGGVHYLGLGGVSLLLGGNEYFNAYIASADLGVTMTIAISDTIAAGGDIATWTSGTLNAGSNVYELLSSFTNASNVDFSQVDDIRITLSGAVAFDASSTTFEITDSPNFVPEPSSTALLGLGGLALVLRRKRS